MDPVMLGAFNGHQAAANSVRLFIIFVGFTLALTCVRFAYIAVRNKETYRVFAILSFALLVVTPSVSALSRFNAPLNPISTTTYCVGLLLGVLALGANYTVSPGWIKKRQEADARERAERLARRADKIAMRNRHQTEDDERSSARGAEDDALGADRSREDAVTEEHRVNERDDESQ